MADEYRVDLGELETVVRKLKDLQRDMDGPGQKVKYGTTLPQGAFGAGDFQEAHQLSASHDRMQSYMSQVVTALNDLIRDFGDKTERSRGAYEDREQEVKSAMRS
ncbi:hypothetical protein [Streptomyces sp. NPDC003077]|uniref:hypothetical protein n=1 Tax=Streptomyces sp. NPDC003077 TaxID=3154443 RepID=UPI0033AF3FEC